MSSFIINNSTTINAEDWTGIALAPVVGKSADTPSNFMLDVFGRRRRVYLSGSRPYVRMTSKGNHFMVFIEDPYIMELVRGGE